MKLIKYTLACLVTIAFLIHVLSCGKKEQPSAPIPLIDSVAQDPAFRLGKWYSISNGAGFNFVTNPLLDTIWFISDSFAGWTNYGGNPYVFRTTYFNGLYYIVTVAPNPFDTVKLDTSSIQCGMTTTGDTFILFKPTSNSGIFRESFLRLKN
jgi:hypothetical protein